MPDLDDGWLAGNGSDAFTAVPDWILDRTDLSHGAFRLWVVLKSYLHRGRDVAWPRRSVLAKRMGLAKPDSVDRFVRELVDARLLNTSAHYSPNEAGGVVRGSNRYLLAVVSPLPPYRGDPPPESGGTLPPKQGEKEADPRKQIKGSTLDLAVEAVPKATKPRGEVRPEVEALAAGIVELLRENHLAARVDANARKAAERILAKPAATSVDVALAVVSFGTHDDRFWRRVLSTPGKVAENWEKVMLAAPRDALAAAAPATQPGRRRNGEWEPLLAEDGDEARAWRFLARSVDPEVWYRDGIEDREALLDRILALPVVYGTRSDAHAALMNAWRLRWSGGSYTAEVPGFVPVRV